MLAPGYLGTMLTLALSLLACGAAPTHDHQTHRAAHEKHGATVHHRFDDAEEWAKVFDNPERDAWQKPEVLVGALSLAHGDAVADIGAGTGYFMPHLSRAVGAEGTVIAIDIEPNLVAHMKSRAERDGLSQVQVRLGLPDDPKLGPAEVDVVLIVDTYHHISDRIGYFGRLASTLQPGGRLVVVDFKKDPAVEHGPPVEHRLSRDTVAAELVDAGWKVAPSEDLLEAQYVIVATPG